VNGPRERVALTNLTLPREELSEGSQSIAAPSKPPAPSNFFDRNAEERVEIIEGILREGDIAVLAGNYGKGKSPAIADLTIHLINGREWCGRKVSKRPIVVLDFESPGPDYKKTIRVIATRLEVPEPGVPGDLAVFLERDDSNEPATKQLLNAIAEPGNKPKMALIESALKDKPNAVVFIDPLTMLFSTQKQGEILSLYRDFRKLLHKFPHAAIVCTFNLRKQDRKGSRPDLLSDPRGWLEEVSGWLDILNRCDVRLGIETHHDDVRVINGIVRGREMHPLLIRSVRNTNDQLAGFEQVTPDQFDLLTALTETMKRYWDRLPSEFRFEKAVADGLVPRSTLSRLIEKTKQLGALKRGEDGVFRKQTGGGS
jgi:hypothetical protein